jgi:L-alanine-DL-glutamate epimerase-like enolase superfamily enzyme
MKITGLGVIPLRVPGWTGATFDGSYDNCLVVVSTDTGLSGIAEVDSVPSVVQAIVEAPASHRHAMGLKAAIIGEDATDIARLWERMYDATFYYGRRGAVIHAISGIDIALWDIKGKAEGRSVCDLLGERRRDRVRAYGTVYPLGETVDEARRNVDRGLARGLRAIKICAEPDWHLDLGRTESLVRAVREHVGPQCQLMVDAASAWRTPEDGLALMPVFKAHDFAWVEAPLPPDDIDGHARFQGFGIPIGGGDLGLTTRFEYEQLFERGKVDIAQPDASMVGGLSEMLRVAELARSRGKRIVPHGYKTDLTIATNLAFLGQHRDDELLEFSTSRSPLRETLTTTHFEIDRDGMVAVPSTPGLGIDVDWAVVERYRA